MRVRTRIAPSPTGFAHVGTAYAAVLNYAFAKKSNGSFLLRIEDTDVSRNVKEGEQVIVSGLKWLGLSWNEGPFRQSDRLDIYKKYSEKLLDKGKAYEEDGGVIFKVQVTTSVSWNDLVREEISFPPDQVRDFAILKKDGFPTYNFAVVVDDHEMNISHVIRAEEHISNTPRQIVLYKALGFDLPRFAHFPLLRRADRSKISKRKDPVSLEWYRKQGYLPEALVNYLCLLGWSHPKGKEIFSLDEFVENFSIERVRKAGPIFDIDKLDWLNGEYIRNLRISNLESRIYDFYKGEYPKDKIKKIAPLVKTRIKKLSEFEDLAGFFFKKFKLDPKLFGKNHKMHLKVAYKVLQKVSGWKLETINKVLMEAVNKNKFKTGQFFMDLRVAITGSKVTPPINESIVILGKSETLKRLKK